MLLPELKLNWKMKVEPLRPDRLQRQIARTLQRQIARILQRQIARTLQRQIARILQRQIVRTLQHQGRLRVLLDLPTNLPLESNFALLGL
ncbi:MAG: hypothetical protein ACJAT6_000984 [Akkermansiaceae bacterium]|jgi:hypothetical protein